MMTALQAASTHRFVLAIAFALALTVMGCATGPLGSHGVDYIPAFDAPYQGKG